ncbi:MAG: sugar transferase [Clostridia bacterium]|nr:sugar transferase [Clostridia bacterium]
MKWYWIVLICVGSVASWVIFSAVLYKPFFKRFYDIVLSFLAMMVLSPLLLILTIIGAIAMKGNPFFTQLRPGKKNKKTGQEKIFKLIKFRTMSNAKDENGNLLPDEVRLNKYGKFLRSTSLDEIPELLNIFVGDLSIVGPRPQLVRDMVFMTDEQRRRHDVRQGLTGLAQCSGRNNMTWEQKFAYDLEYVSNITLFGDIKILFKTVFKVLKRDGINEDGLATAEDYGDYLLSNWRVSKEEYDALQEKAKVIINKGF